MGRTIVVVPYDASWATKFAEEARSIAAVFGQKLLQIHHVGSTSVVGLHAKPIIDILVVLVETDSISDFNSAMEQIGYRVRGECLDATVPGTPGRFYFTKDIGGVRSFHVHVCADGHNDVRDKLALRDYLRTHPNVAADYGAHKEGIAALNRYDNVGYMRGKDAVVKRVLVASRE